MDDRLLSVQDPVVLLAGIKQFGLAPDGSDLRDLTEALSRLIRERDDALNQLRIVYSVSGQR